MAEETAGKWKLGKLGCVVLALAVVGGLLAWDRACAANKPQTELKANVRFAGSEFVVRNDCAFDWTGGRLEINGKFRADFAALKAGKVVSIPVGQLVDSSGARLNPYQIKPQNASLTADTPHGKLSNYFRWK